MIEAAVIAAVAVKGAVIVVAMTTERQIAAAAEVPATKGVWRNPGLFAECRATLD